MATAKANIFKVRKSREGPPCQHCGHIHVDCLFEFGDEYYEGIHDARCQNPECGRAFTFWTTTSVVWASKSTNTQDTASSVSTEDSDA